MQTNAMQSSSVPVSQPAQPTSTQHPQPTSATKLKVAAVQMVSGVDVDANLAMACQLVARAADQGADLVCLPEYWPLMGMQETDKLACAEQSGHGRLQETLSNLAARHQIWLIGGTVPLASVEPAKVMNTMLAFGPDGQQRARYDKMHLFSFSRGDESYDEGRTISAGHSVESLSTPFGKVGLSVCYDLRFPELYRAMGECILIVVPAAFTYTTGAVHWEILLRARAIENQCYVLAAAQGGVHANGRRTWGHSMLIDPWGEVVAILPTDVGVCSGIIDLEKLATIRQNLPALQHRRLV
jgi:predicted amidohydrolase